MVCELAGAREYYVLYTDEFRDVALSFRCILTTPPLGCNNCKIGKIKCDRHKPMCKICIRRELQCDYKRRLKWVNSNPSEGGPGEEGYKPPKLKRGRLPTKGDPDLSKNETQKPVADLDPATGMPATRPDKSNSSSPNTGSSSSVSPISPSSHFSGAEPRFSLANGQTQYPPELSRSTAGCTSMSAQAPQRLSADAPFMNHNYSIAGPSPLTPVSHNTSHFQLEQNEGYGLGERVYQHQQNHVPMGHCEDSFHMDHVQPTNFQHGLDAPVSSQNLNIVRALFNKLEDQSLRPLINHFIHCTCACLDPVHGNNINENISIHYYIPPMLQSQSALYSILSVGALHLREVALNNYQSEVEVENYSEIAIEYKALSFQHLAREIQAANNTATEPILSTVLIQLILSTFEAPSQDQELILHLNTWHETIKSILFSGMRLSNDSRYSLWHLAVRIAKCDTFAALSHRRNPILRVTMLQDAGFVAELEKNWGGVPKWAVVCACISFWSTNQDPALAYHREAELSYVGHLLAQRNPPNSNNNNNSSPLAQIAAIWETTTNILYNRLILHTSAAHPAVTTFLTSAIAALCDFCAHHAHTYFGAALSFPLFVLATNVLNPHEHRLLHEGISELYRFLNLPSFGQLLSTCETAFRCRGDGSAPMHIYQMSFFA